MSTRATYQIFDDTFYIHHDGYLEGAAMYFFNMVKASRHIRNGIWDWSKPKGGAPFAFIRGNANCEPTTGHDAHGDTEFHYTVWEETAEGYKGRLMIVASQRAGWLEDTWRYAFSGTLVDFINKYYKREIIEVRSNERFYLCTAEQALEAAEGYLEQSKKFDDTNPNKISYLDTAKTLNRALDELDLQKLLLAGE